MLKVEPSYQLIIFRDIKKNISKGSYIDYNEKSFVAKSYKTNICPIVLYHQALKSQFFDEIIFK
jgi:hypothetical protein